MTIKELDQSFIAATYGRHDVTFVRGRGAELFDDAGRRYIDLGGGIAVNSFGIADETWAAAVKAQVDLLQHVSNHYYTEPQAVLAQLLCERTDMRRVFFSNSGAEANECAIKAARKFAGDKYGASVRPNIVTLYNSFHGRTVTTLSATGQESFHKDFGPFTPGFLHVPANDITAMKRALEPGDVCAVMMELIQGEGGVVTLEPAYVREVAALCARQDVLLVIDEVQTGNGRTGELYCYMNYRIRPDIVSTAKGLAGGLPMGATLFNEKAMFVLGPGSHGSTFGGNPVCAAGAVSVIGRLTDDLLAEVREKGAYIREELERAPGVRSVDGLGLMLGVEPERRPANEVLLACLERGVVVLTAKEKIRLLPPLNIPMPLLKEAVAVLKEELAK